MIIPIGTDRPLKRPTVVNHILIALNVLVYFVTVMPHAAASGTGPTEPGQPNEQILHLFSLARDQMQPWRFITYGFLHGSWMHILGNMLALWVFGPNVEDKLGRIGYLLFYLGGAVASGLAHIAFSHSPVVGASGAIAAITGAYMIFFPKTEIKTFIFFFYIGIFYIPAVWFIILAIGRDFIAGPFGGDNVAHVAHLGGYAMGIAASFLLLWTKRVEREMFDVFAIMDRAKRRREMREAAIDPNAAQNRVRTDATKAVAGKLELNIPLLNKPQPPAEPPIPDEVSTARADIASRIARGDLPGAAGAFASLLALHPAKPRWLTFGRHNLLSLGEYYYQQGDYARAASVFALFLDAYPRDSQNAHTMLLTGMIHAKYLNNIDAARRLIAAAMPGLREAEDISLAKELLAELGPPPVPSSAPTTV